MAATVNATMIHLSGTHVSARIRKGSRLGISPGTSVPSRRNGTQLVVQKVSVKKSLWRNPRCHLVSTGGLLKPCEPTEP